MTHDGGVESLVGAGGDEDVAEGIQLLADETAVQLGEGIDQANVAIAASVLMQEGILVLGNVCQRVGHILGGSIIGKSLTQVQGFVLHSQSNVFVPNTGRAALQSLGKIELLHLAGGLLVTKDLQLELIPEAFLGGGEG